MDRYDGEETWLAVPDASSEAGTSVDPELTDRWLHALYETPQQFSGMLDDKGVVIAANRLSIEGCGLVRDEVTGRRRLYRLVPAGLDPLRCWLAEVTPAVSGQVDPAATASEGPAWTSRLDALETEVRRTRRARHQTDRADAATGHPASTKETA